MKSMHSKITNDEVISAIEIICSSFDTRANDPYAFSEWIANTVFEKSRGELIEGNNILTIISKIFQKLVPKTINSSNDALTYLCFEFVIQPWVKQNKNFGDLKKNNNHQEYLENNFDRIKGIYRNFGLTIEDPPYVKVVECYPEPFSRVLGTALAPDKTDQRLYNMPNALLFRKDKLHPVSSLIVLSHEYVHSHISDDGMLARGLEEGLADFLSLFIAGPSITSTQTVRSFFYSKRFSFTGPHQKFRTYVDYLRQATWLYRNFGSNGICHIINGGRGFIKEVEIALQGNSSKVFGLGIPSDKPNAKVMNFAEEICFLTAENEVVSPESFVLCGIETGAFKNLKINNDLKIKCLKEIQDRLFGVLLGSENNIEFSDINTLFANKSFRFELPSFYS